MHSNLHQAQSHEILRSWQSQRHDVNHPKDFVLPLFVGNNDQAIEAIESMPGVFRYGCATAIDYLEPLINQYSLAAVLLFPVVTKNTDELAQGEESSEDDEGGISSSTSSQSRSSLTGSESSRFSTTLSDDDEVVNDTTRRSNDVQDGAASTLGNSNNGGSNNNPFLSQNEETENLIDTDHQVERRQSVGRWLPVASQENSPKSQPGGLMRISKAEDIKLIKGMALQDEHNPVLRLIPRLRERFPGLLIICDVCLCAFTSTGHCCLFEDHARAKGGSVGGHFPISNKLTCQYLAALSVEYAKRGCDVVAPSDMMDGRILTIRERLNENGMNHISVLSYSAKFASSFYGPFRNATANAPEFGDRRAYQLPPGSRALALKAVQRDIDQGADFVMVKPAGAYLDIVRDIKNEHPEVPIAVYQVSGEYSMLMSAAKAGLVNLKQAVYETLTSFRRAGATIIITYFTPDILRNEL